jgi:hypothetical protein
MSEEEIKDDNGEEKKNDTGVNKPDDGEYNYKRDHGRSLQQIQRDSIIAGDAARASQEEKRKTEESQADDEGKPAKGETREEETPIKPPKEEVKTEPRIDVKEVATQAAQEATRIAQEAFKKQIDDILDSKKPIEDKQTQADELISIWDKEGRLPTDYKEVVAESIRIADAKYTQREKEARRIQEEETVRKQKEADESASRSQKAQQETVEKLNENIKTELTELMEAKYLPKADVDNDQDPNRTELDKFLKFGIELNQKRAAEKLNPIQSVNKMYFMHYKPFLEASGAKKSDQPAGERAPIAGNRSSSTKETEDAYIYARDHKKTYRQILTEARERSK